MRTVLSQRTVFSSLCSDRSPLADLGQEAPDADDRAGVATAISNSAVSTAEMRHWHV